MQSNFFFPRGQVLVFIKDWFTKACFPITVWLNGLLAKRQAFNDSFQSRFNVYLIAKKKLYYYPSSIITHKNLQQRRL